jgi:hypothetical protein
MKTKISATEDGTRRGTGKSRGNVAGRKPAAPTADRGGVRGDGGSPGSAKAGPGELPPLYRVFSSAPRTPSVLVQIRRVKTRELIPADDLRVYRLLSRINLPWFQHGVRVGSQLWLADDAAEALAGGIEPIPEKVLVRWRVGYEAQSEERKARRFAKI